MEPIADLSHRCKVLSSSMRQMHEKLNAIGVDLDRIASMEVGLASMRSRFSECEQALEEAKLHVVRCEVACRFDFCQSKWEFIENSWTEVVASYSVLPILSSCPE